MRYKDGDKVRIKKDHPDIVKYCYPCCRVSCSIMGNFDSIFILKKVYMGAVGWKLCLDNKTSGCSLLEKHLLEVKIKWIRMK